MIGATVAAFYVDSRSTCERHLDCYQTTHWLFGSSSSGTFDRDLHASTMYCSVLEDNNGFQDVRTTPNLGRIAGSPPVRGLPA